MDDLLRTAFNTFVALTVVLTALAVGLEVTRSMVATVVRRRVFPIVLAVNLVAVPMVGLGIVTLLGLEGGARIGVLICAIAAGGPLGLKTSQIARGDMSLALSLVVILMLTNVATIPLWSGLLFTQTITLRPAELLGGLVVVVLIPALVGSVLRLRNSGRAAAWASPLFVASNVTLGLAVGLGIASDIGELWQAATSAIPWAALLILVAAFAMARPVAGTAAEQRVTMLVTPNRAASLALLVVSRGFAEYPDALTAVITFGAFQTAGTVALALLLRSSAAVEAPSV